MADSSLDSLTDARLTRRQLLAGSTGLAAAAGASLSGCTSLATTVAAQTMPEAVRPLVRQMADPSAAVASGEAWVAFCDSLKPLARHFTGPESNGDLLEQTEGLRCLSRLVSLGLDRFLEHGDPRYPSFYELQTATRKYLGDNPDQTYRGIALEGSGTYRIRGRAADAAGVEIGVYGGTFRSDAKEGNGGRRLVDSLDERTIQFEDDGSFEILVGAGDHRSGQGANSLQLSEDANALLIRTYFWDRDRRLQHEMPTVERLDLEGPRPSVDPTALLRGFIATSMFVDGSLSFWNDFEGFDTGPNELIVMPDDGSVQTPSLVQYINGWVELEPDEALIVEFEPEDEPGYWSWVLVNTWGESMDWRDRSVILNNRDVARDPSGRVRIVVSHRNPRVANWLDMSGHRRLLLSLRWRGASALPTVRTNVVALSSLEDES